MGILSLLLIIFGIVPASLALIYDISGMIFPRIFLPKFKFQSWDMWYTIKNKNAVSWKNIGGSSIRLASIVQPMLAIGGMLTQVKEPKFSTLECKTHQLSKARWRFEIEFEIRNLLNREIVIDDIHAYHLETNAFAPPLLTISFYGDAWLRQDNTLLKEKRDYSLAPGDGYIINLLFEATRIEAAPAYGARPAESEGRMTIVFGLLLDYYSMPPSGLDRRAIPSDGIYIFQYPGDGIKLLKCIDPNELKVLKRRHSDNKETQEFIQRLEQYLSEHLSFRPLPQR